MFTIQSRNYSKNVHKTIWRIGETELFVRLLYVILYMVIVLFFDTLFDHSTPRPGTSSVIVLK